MFWQNEPKNRSRQKLLGRDDRAPRARMFLYATSSSQRHGLAAITHRLPIPSGELERLARAICGADEDPALFAQAIAVADNELALRAIRERQVNAAWSAHEPRISA